LKTSKGKLQGFTSGKNVFDEQFSFKKQTAERPPLMKTSQYQSRRFLKAFSKFKSVWG
jgi:hypothetical protein